MTNEERLPTELTPVNIRAYLTNAFGICECMEMEEVLAALQWILDEFNHKGNNPPIQHPRTIDAGMFYLLAARLQRLQLVEHGCSIRCAWLSFDGERLRQALRGCPVSSIDNAIGTAYDGCDYE